MTSDPQGWQSGLARVELSSRDGCLIARIVGEVDLSNALELEETALAAVPYEAVSLVLDLEGVSYFDSAGVRLVLNLSEELTRRGQTLRLVVPEDAPARRVLTLTEISKVVTLVGSVDEAVQA